MIFFFVIIPHLLVEIHYLAHRHDIHLQPPSIEGYAPAVHPTEFLKFQAERVVVYPALLIRCLFLAHGQLPVKHRQMILAIRQRQLGSQRHINGTTLVTL